MATAVPAVCDRPDPPPDGAARRLAGALLHTVSRYLLAGWAYIALVAVARPDSLAAPLWHSAHWLRRDTFGAVAFAGSFVTYVAAGCLRP